MQLLGVEILFIVQELGMVLWYNCTSLFIRLAFYLGFKSVTL